MSRHSRRRRRSGSLPQAAGAIAVLVVGYEVLVHVPDWAWALGGLVVMAGVVGGPAWLIARRIRRYRRWQLLGMAEIDLMTGDQFEMRAMVAFRDCGYQVRHLGRSGDYGGDLLVTGGGRHMVVQCKRYAQPVGVKAIQEAHAARAHYRVPEAAVLTNSTFTPAALRLARETGVACWGRGELEALLLRARRAKGAEGRKDIGTNIT